MWRGAMTFCGGAEAVESCGRAADWGAQPRPGCQAGDEPSAAVGSRPGAGAPARPGQFRGALGAAARAAAPRQRERSRAERCSFQ